MMPPKPFLLLDIDGVLCPFGCQDDPDGFVKHYLNQGPFADDWVWVSADNTRRLQQLSEKFLPVWATAWEHLANDSLGPWHDLPPLKVIEFSSDIGRARLNGVSSWKLPWIKEWAERNERPLLWVDDDAHEDAEVWAQERTRAGLPTRVHRTECAIGLTDEAVHNFLAWCP